MAMTTGTKTPATLSASLEMGALEEEASSTRRIIWARVCLLYTSSKLRSVEESASISKNNINIAAYQDGYTGIGGFGYCHYLFVTDNSPLPWTACAFIAYMTCTADGFSAWGKEDVYKRQIRR